MSHPGNGHDVTVDRVEDCCLVVVFKLVSRIRRHPNIINQDSDRQSAQFRPNLAVDGMAISEIRSNRFDLHRPVLGSCRNEFPSDEVIYR